MVDLSDPRPLREQHVYISSVLPAVSSGDRNPDPLTVLPWSSQSCIAIPLPGGSAGLAYIRSEAATTAPNCTYSNDTYLKSLKECSAWFLFTDGEIAVGEVETFSKNTTRLGLHGTAAKGPPGGTNFSVGISTYPLAPNSLFLFHDISTETVYLLQAKGSFQVLLPAGTSQPILDNNLRWPQVPRITYHDLAKVIIPPPRLLSEDERVLQDGLVIRLKEIYGGTASQETLQRVAHRRT
ncbi:hypothetical protein ACEPPN_008232 [Leptodophora sp. 'Broadleaf-Isolate-01']